MSRRIYRRIGPDPAENLFHLLNSGSERAASIRAIHRVYRADTKQARRMRDDWYYRGWINDHDGTLTAKGVEAIAPKIRKDAA